MLRRLCASLVVIGLIAGGAAFRLAPSASAQGAKPETGKPQPELPAKNPTPKRVPAEKPAAAQTAEKPAAATAEKPAAAPIEKPVAAPAAEKPTAAPARQVLIPDADNILVLIRTSLLTLNDAVLTGNFTVFRDKMAPSARAELTTGRLFKAFEHLATRRVNMSGLSLLAPELTEPPALDADGRLKLRGVFKNEPVGIGFHLLYELADAEWMLRGISVKLVTANAAAAEAASKPKTQ